MTVGKAIFYLLDNSTDLTAIVGTRIFPEVAQQDAPLPYVVYNISNNEPSDTKREPSKMDTANIEVNCYSTSYTQVIDMSVAVRAALDRVTGTYSGVNVQSIAYMNEVIDFDEGQRAYNVSSDYDVRISRTDFEIAQGSPITGVDLGDLADVNTTGVTDGQVIAYDAATAVWLPATDAGGAEQLNDLSDVIISLPASGEFFRYDGDEWVNDTANKSDVGLGNVDNTSDANKPISTATQTALDAKPDNLRQLNDVTISGPATDQVLQYDGADWVNATFSAATSLEDLTDVDIADAPANGSLLEYNLNLGLWQDSGSNRLPTDGVYFHQRYETESEALRTGATATTELYFTCTAQGNGLAESASSDTPTAGKIIKRKIYYSEEGFADPDTGTWVEFTPAPADDASFATVKAALLEYLKARTGGTVPISLKQTWEEVAAAPAFTGLLNETYGSGAEAAYSTRRLNGNYSGACMTIRRTDGTTQTIGFDASGNISEADIISFCTGSTCTVQVWHDQSQTGGTGSGNDATQSDPTKQPTIYTGGALVKENGKLALDFDGVSNTLVNTTVSVADYGFTLVNLNTYPSTSGIPSGLYDNTATSIYYHNNQVGGTGGFNNRIQARNSSTGQTWVQSVDGKNTLSYLSFDSSTTRTITADGNLNSTNNSNITFAAPNSFSIGAMSDSSPAGYINSNIQEVLLLNDIKNASDQTSIEENVGDYFTQNTPLLDTYSGAAAAYSLRLLDSSYVGSAIRVRRSSDNTEQDIGFNVFGELDTVSLLAFAGTGSAYVKVWYCQSGNSNDATQTATGSQPKIVSSGAVIVENGKPAVENVLSGAQGLNIPSFTINLSDFTSTVVSKFYADSGTEGRAIMINGDTQASYDYRYKQFSITRGRFYLGTSTVQSYNNNVLYTSTNNLQLHTITPTNGYVDGTSAGTFGTAGEDLDLNPAFNYLTSGDIGRDRGTHANTSEVIIWTADQTGNRTNIETNIATFYGITL